MCTAVILLWSISLLEALPFEEQTKWTFPLRVNKASSHLPLPSCRIRLPNTCQINSLDSLSKPSGQHKERADSSSADSSSLLQARQDPVGHYDRTAASIRTAESVVTATSILTAESVVA